ncbi:hypothetical protein ISN45_Aa07g032170, partial [Arabidopsis thaliana x Arabidopsis arenosa]
MCDKEAIMVQVEEIELQILALSLTKCFKDRAMAEEERDGKDKDEEPKKPCFIILSILQNARMSLSRRASRDQQFNSYRPNFIQIKWKPFLGFLISFQNDIPLTGRLGLTCSSPYFKPCEQMEEMEQKLFSLKSTEGEGVKEVSYTKLITKLLEIIQAVDMSWTYQIRTKLCQVSFCLSFSYSRFYSLRVGDARLHMIVVVPFPSSRMTSYRIVSSPAHHFV